MRIFRKRPEESVSSLGISGVKKVTTPKEPEVSEVLLGFPAIGPAVEKDEFDTDDVELAKKLLEATSEQLVGTAALFLARGELTNDEADTTFAIAYLMLAQTRRSEVKPAFAQID